MHNVAVYHQSGYLENSPHKALFIAAMKHSGEPLARISAETLGDKMVLVSLLRSVLPQLEEELRAAIPLVTAQDQVSNICKAA